jgi:hypothetical protein
VRLGRSVEVCQWVMQVSETRVQIMVQCQALRRPLEALRNQLLPSISREFTLFVRKLDSSQKLSAINATRDTFEGYLLTDLT